MSPRGASIQTADRSCHLRVPFISHRLNELGRLGSTAGPKNNHSEAPWGTANPLGDLLAIRSKADPWEEQRDQGRRWRGMREMETSFQGANGDGDNLPRFLFAVLLDGILLIPFPIPSLPIPEVAIPGLQRP